MNPTLGHQDPDSLVLPKPIQRTKEAGQASIEFILTIAFTLGISLLFIMQALNMTKGYMAHYVAYMTGRTFLTQEDARLNNTQNINTAQQIARSTFNNYTGDGLDLGEPQFVYGEGSILFTGVTITYDERLSLLPLVGGDARATFHTEAMLGKEPTRIECMRSICNAFGNGTECYDKEQLITIMDNGC